MTDTERLLQSRSFVELAPANVRAPCSIRAASVNCWGRSTG